MKKNKQTASYEMGETVFVLLTCTEEDDPESFYYFKQFEKKRRRDFGSDRTPTSPISCKIWPGGSSLVS
ncbi:hypothetical protein RCO48_08695 [Peribacillus frigoritolerans]|nr:hypothetical protein [Peribacillus frigoritolerans]